MIPVPPASSSTSGDRATPGPMKRRKFLDWLLGGSFAIWLGSVLYPVIRYLVPPVGPAIRETTVKVGRVQDFAMSSGTLFRIGSKPGILVRTSAGEFRAFLAICTHLQCTVQFKKDEGVIWCACHNGRYNLQGTNISGPPPRPLPPLEVALKGDEVYVSLAS